jgi:hypothetical protein
VKENEGVRIVSAPNIGSKGPVRSYPECDIVKGCEGRSSIEPFVCLDWERGGRVICDEHRGMCLEPRIDSAFGC